MKLPALPWLSVALFAISCLLPAFTVQRSAGSSLPASSWSGALTLGIGWMGAFTEMWPWFANPLWIMATIFLLLNRSRPAALILCVAALALAGTTFTLIGKQFPADEGGVTMQAITRLEAGAYVWFACLASQTLVAGYLVFRK